MGRISWTSSGASLIKGIRCKGSKAQKVSKKKVIDYVEIILKLPKKKNVVERLAWLWFKNVLDDFQES